MGLEQVRLLVLDFDGVLTSNTVYVDQNGRETVRCYRGDGLGIERVKALGASVVVISGETNPVVEARCRKLGLACHWGIEDKLQELIFRCALEAVRLEHVAYLGNDLNDLGCLSMVGHPFAPRDAEPELLERVPRAVRLRRRGGMGCVRELCDLIAAAKEGAA